MPLLTAVTAVTVLLSYARLGHPFASKERRPSFLKTCATMHGILVPGDEAVFGLPETGLAIIPG